MSARCATVSRILVLHWGSVEDRTIDKISYCPMSLGREEVKSTCAVNLPPFLGEDFPKSR